MSGDDTQTQVRIEFDSEVYFVEQYRTPQPLTTDALLSMISVEEVDGRYNLVGKKWKN